MTGLQICDGLARSQASFGVHCCTSPKTSQGEFYFLTKRIALLLALDVNTWDEIVEVSQGDSLIPTTTVMPGSSPGQLSFDPLSGSVRSPYVSGGRDFLCKLQFRKDLVNYRFLLIILPSSHFQLVDILLILYSLFILNIQSF